MTAVTVEVALPPEHQTIEGVMEHRDKLVTAATELGWPNPHSTDTKTQLVGGVPLAVALTREKRPVAVGLHWAIDGDLDGIHRDLAAIHDRFDISYAMVNGVYVAADHPEIRAAEHEMSGDHA
ncbi:hypothetical protein VT930_16895 [Mycobacterium sherrisii]|uniref:hypothetical protein n=1 Tax=Mycobacterium sherrisii TaxID=243061 RepID=UPI002DDD4121|nr:hypothetical protein [Mycobacterium sherrisii]MEC4764770.1 hypothetical protein [Mycobacterium sherrisii]